MPDPITRALDDTEAEALGRARRFAIEAHGTQRYGDQPYVFHLDQVRDVLLRFGRIQLELQGAALLHDTLEDTATNYNDLVRRFGTDVAELVYAVTDEVGRNRYERHIKTYPKMREHAPAITLKLADRIANIEHSIRTGDRGKLDMYMLEHPDLEEALKASGGPTPMWDHLARLLKLGVFKAPENCGFSDQDRACLGCGNRRGSSAYCLLSQDFKNL